MSLQEVPIKRLFLHQTPTHHNLHEDTVQSSGTLRTHITGSMQQQRCAHLSANLAYSNKHQHNCKQVSHPQGQSLQLLSLQRPPPSLTHSSPHSAGQQPQQKHIVIADKAASSSNDLSSFFHGLCNQGHPADLSAKASQLQSSAAFTRAEHQV